MPGKEEPLEDSIVAVDATESHESEVEAVNPDPQPTWVSLAAALLPLLLCFGGTGRSPFALGFAATCVGLLALLFPPKGKVPLVLLAAAGVVVAFTLLPLIPLPWPHWPAWRTPLVDDYHIALPSTWSLQPRVTFEVWCSTIVMGVWLFWTVNRQWPADERIVATRVLAAGFVCLAVASLAFLALHWKPASWNDSPKDLGPYANRNHLSTLMAMAALLCYGVIYEYQRRKNRLWMLFALGIIPLLTVTMFNTSRAGLVLFFVGTMLWFISAAMRGGGSSMHRQAARIAVALTVTASIMFVLIACVVLFAGPLLQRFGGTGSTIMETLSNDGRLAIYSEAAPLAVDQPMLGVGLGNFNAVFSLVHHLPNSFTRYRHPESDWLWLLCEAGWPVTVAMVVGLLFLMTLMEPWRPSSHKKGRRERRLRRAAGLAFLLSVGHGLVDTPNHDVPHLSLVILLGALSLRPNRLDKAKGVAVPWLFRLGGAGSLAAAAVWFATGAGIATPFGQSVTERNTALAKMELDAGKPSTAYAHANQAIAASPANNEAYYLRAFAALAMGRGDTEAMADFGISRYLEPHLTKPCLNEAEIWLHYSPINALPAWREALQRSASEANNNYRKMLDTVGTHSPLRPALRDLANRPGLLAIYLSTAQGEEVKATLDLILQRYPTLDGMTPSERQLIVSRWQNYGDRKKLSEFLAAHPALEPDTWRTRAELLADEGKLDAAFKLVQQFVRTPGNSYSDQTLSMAQMETDFQIHPSDPKRGLFLYSAQKDRAQWDAALATLEKVAALPERPKHVYFEMAIVYAQKGDLPKAWQLAQQYLNMPE